MFASAPASAADWCRYYKSQTELFVEYCEDGFTCDLSTKPANCVSPKGPAHKSMSRALRPLTDNEQIGNEQPDLSQRSLKSIDWQIKQYQQMIEMLQSALRDGKKTDRFIQTSQDVNYGRRSIQITKAGPRAASASCSTITGLPGPSASNTACATGGTVTTAPPGLSRPSQQNPKATPQTALRLPKGIAPPGTIAVLADLDGLEWLEKRAREIPVELPPEPRTGAPAPGPAASNTPPEKVAEDPAQVTSDFAKYVPDLCGGGFDTYTEKAGGYDVTCVVAKNNCQHKMVFRYRLSKSGGCSDADLKLANLKDPDKLKRCTEQSPIDAAKNGKPGKSDPVCTGREGESIYNYGLKRP